MEILEILKNHLVIAEVAMTRYCRIAAVRRGNSLQEQLLSLINNNDNQLMNLKNSRDNDLLNELKLLDEENVRCVLRNQNLREPYKSYLELFLEESRHPHIDSPTKRLSEAEYTIFKDFSAGIKETDKSILRVILQEWFLYPQLICDKTCADQLLREILEKSIIL